MIDTVDERIEGSVLAGLIMDPAFLKHFVEMRVSPGIFVGEHAEWKKQIAEKTVRFFDLYRRPPALGVLLEDFEREANLGGENAALVMANVRVVIRKAMETQPMADMLPSYLTRQLSIYQETSYVKFMTEAGERFMVCRFKHGEHVLCKGCPVWGTCRGMTKKNLDFATALFEMTQIKLAEITQAAGSQTIETGSLLDAAKAALEDYESDKRTLTKGEIVGIKAPWETLNRLAGGWVRGRLYGIQAERKKGKTTCLLNCAEAALKGKANTLFCYMEDRPKEMGAKLLSMITGTSHTDFMLRTLTEKEQEKLYPKLHEYLELQEAGELGSIESLYAPLRSLGLRNIIRTLEEAEIQGKPYDLILFDHLHIADVNSAAANKSLLLVEFAEGLQAISRRYNVAVVVASQLKTSGDRKGQTRWSDEIEDCFDAVFRLQEIDSGFWLNVYVSRFFSPFNIPLVDRRDLMRLEEKAAVTYDFPDLEDVLPIGDGFLEG